jgi:hypothetical protein
MRERISTREHETRLHEKRVEYNMGYVSPLDVPDCVKKDGFTQVWVPTEVRGAPTRQVEQMAARGWTLVPADRAPDFSFDPLKRTPLASQYICSAELILMERPTIYSDRDREYRNRMNESKINNLPGVANDMSTFASPIKTINTF